MLNPEFEAVKHQNMVTIANLRERRGGDDALLQIFSMLPYRDLISVGRTCKQLRGLAQEDVLWRRIARRNIIGETWNDENFHPSRIEIGLAIFLVQHNHLDPGIVTGKAAHVVKHLSCHSMVGFSPSPPLLRVAAALVTHGYITQLERLKLQQLDMSLVPAEDLARLAACVRDNVIVARVSGDLAPVLSSVQCRVLDIGDTSLSPANTQQLVTAMARGVREVELEGVTLDMETLAQYDGGGECGELWVKGDDTMRRYGDQVKEWAGRMGWRVERDDFYSIQIRRSEEEL